MLRPRWFVVGLMRNILLWCEGLGQQQKLAGNSLGHKHKGFKGSSVHGTRGRCFGHFHNACLAPATTAFSDVCVSLYQHHSQS
jgi:hypothetical protein